MQKTTFFLTLTMTVLLVGTISAPLTFTQTAAALKGQGVPTKNYGSATKSVVCGDQLCSDLDEDEQQKYQDKKKEEVKTAKKETEKMKAEATKSERQKSVDESHKTEQQEYLGKKLQSESWKTTSGTVTSEKDPGIGHEYHQIALLLPPGQNIYKGHLTYTASEDVQLVTLHGPLSKDDAKGQPTWTVDGKKIYGLTVVDQKSDSGIWTFSGKALAVHSMKPEPFSLTYSVTYKEFEPTKTIYSTSMTSMKSMGLGHEGHQIAMILPLSDQLYRGRVTFTASEPVQFVSLQGPLGPGEDKGQPIWTPDGKTKYGFTFIKADRTSGTWEFSGNGIAFHTMKQTPFTVSYTVVLESTE